VIEIVRTAGGNVTIQDLGRPGYAHLGVGRSGAADRGALRLANRLVGNPPGAAGLEITFGGLVFIARQAITVALTGAAAAGPLGWGAAVTLAAGTEIEIGRPAQGLRSYLAVRGGIEAVPVLGSRSTDVLGGLGPAPVTAGQTLALGRQFATEISGEVASPVPTPAALRVLAGPRADWFSADALTTLTTTAWTVRPDSNRIGVRLDGPALTRVQAGELATEPTLPGALQIPPDGRPIVLGPDAPVTGGYPVLAVLADADLDAAGQLRPGDTVRLRL
jgi:biotin-dependent carboxylase-like uncharacterized protein